MYIDSGTLGFISGCFVGNVFWVGLLGLLYMLSKRKVSGGAWRRRVRRND